VLQIGQKLLEGVETDTVCTVNLEVRFIAWLGWSNYITELYECLCELIYVIIDSGFLFVICDKIVELRSCHFTKVFNVNP
jgi:hypothetical protein